MIPPEYRREPWAQEPVYAELFEWVLDNVEHLSEPDAEELVEDLWGRDIPPPSLKAMDALSKWASYEEDNVEWLRNDEELRTELRRYTERHGLDETFGGAGWSSVYDMEIYRALKLPVDAEGMAQVITGESNMEIYRMPAESWTLDVEAAEGFLDGAETGVILSQPKPVPGTLIWNFTNRVLGYDAFRSSFHGEREIILESQCESCTFEEISRAHVAVVQTNATVPEAIALLESALAKRGYSGEVDEELGYAEILALEIYHLSRGYWIGDAEAW